MGSARKKRTNILSWLNQICLLTSLVGLRLSGTPSTTALVVGTQINGNKGIRLLIVNLFCRMQKMFDVLKEQTEMIKEISRRKQEQNEREKDEAPKESSMRSLFGFP